MAQVTRPETHTLTLPSGETLIVKKRLNYGERQDMLAAMRGPDGRMDGTRSGLAVVLAYLLDWTVKDDQSGEPLVIRGKSKSEIEAVCKSLDTEDMKEIIEIVDDHDDKMIAERKAQKKIQNSKETSGPDSPSVTAGPGSVTETSAS